MQVSNIQVSYLKSGAWKGFTNKVQSTMDGLKIQTRANSSYYLQYRTWNEGKSDFYSFVRSNEDAFAGIAGSPIQRLQIQAYKNDGTKLTTGVVVMYRVSNEGRWLPWVSNAQPEWMKSVQAKYKLDGTLDGDSYYAGNAGRNIDGVEILVYEESDIGEYAGGEVFTLLSTMTGDLYHWSPFQKSTAGKQIDGIKIQTGSQDYYLEYRTKNAGNASFYPLVKSTDRALTDYAGYPGKPVQLLSIMAYKSDGTRLRSGIIVMYRVSVKGRWLPWVSNANPEWMRDVQAKYGLGGVLDVDSTYAGNEGQNIDGVEIRIFEDTTSHPEAEDFIGAEIPLTTKSMSGSLNNWKEFSGKLSSTQMDGIKIATAPGASFYLGYQSLNAGNSDYFSMVKSTGTAYNDYAGIPGKPIQLIRIQAYNNDGTRLRSGVVVMYRVSIKGRWLPWVSNADPEWMRSVQQQYHLDGTLDTDSDYAGNAGETIDGVEIRAYKGQTNDHPVGDLPGAEYTPLTRYMVDQLLSWRLFTHSALNDHMDGLKINTGTAKPYYLSYKTWNAGNGDYYPEVKSTDNGITDYAGYPGQPIQLLNINVYRNDGVKIKTGVVVMYRVHVDNRWLPWVSNANPDWMRKAYGKYALDGKLDTESTYAGNKGQNINGVEIRIFEENDTVQEPVGKYKIIENVPFECQKPEFPTGCESVSTVMALNYAGVKISSDEFVDKYLDKKLSGVPFDPNVSFGGNPRKQGGSYGCYAPVIKKALDKILTDKNHIAKVLNGKSVASLCSEYIDKDIPVIFWATTDMDTPYNGNRWSYNGRDIQWISPMHCLVLVGYDEKHYIFNDPLKDGPQTYYRKDAVEKAYAGLFKQAVVLIRDNTEVSPSVPNYGSVENPVTKEIYPIKFYKSGKEDVEPWYELENKASEEKPTRLREANFNWPKFFSGLEFDGGLDNPNNHIVSHGLSCIIIGGIASVKDNWEDLYIDIDYYKVPSTGQKQALVRCGTKTYCDLFKSWVPYGVPASVKSINGTHFGVGGWPAIEWDDNIDAAAKKLYGLYKGITPAGDCKYDIFVTLNSKRINDNYVSQIFLGSDGKMYEYGTIFEDEKVEIVVTKGWPVKNEIDRLDITPFLSPYSQLPPQKAALFNKINIK